MKRSPFSRLAAFFTRFSCLLVALTAILALSAHRVSATVYYVSTTGAGTGASWATAGPLQATITHAVSGDQIWVKAGTYTGNFTATDGVAVYGGFAGTETSLSQRSIAANPTILDGNAAGIVYTIPSAATQTNTLDGFTVRNGLIGSFASGANAYGGGVSDTSSHPLVLANCTFTGNSADGNFDDHFNGYPGNGGAVYAGGSVTITDCTFMGNGVYGSGDSNEYPATGPVSGGAIYAVGPASITGCTFTNNIAQFVVFRAFNLTDGYGGAIFGTTVTLTDCTFIGNGSSADGGAVDANSVTLTGCMFIDNSAAEAPDGYVSENGGGGAVLADTVMATDCTFTGNAALAGDGGAVSTDSATLTGCTFASNSAVGAFGAFGPYSIGGSGGGIAVGTAVIVHCLFLDNSGSESLYAPMPVYGGGASVGGATITDCTFTGNSATFGGGVASSGTVANCLFQGNSPSAIELDTAGTVSAPALVKDNLVIGTGTTTGAPDGIDMDIAQSGDTSYAVLANNTIIDTAIGINLATASGAITVANNILDGNGGGLDDTGAASFVSSHNDAYGNIAYGYQGVPRSASDLSVNPLLVSILLGDDRLTTNSPCINAGDDSDVAAGDTDLDGSPRIQGAHVDLGAYEGAHPIGWTAVAVSAASGGLSHILWTRSDGAAGLWTLNAAGVKTTIGPTYGPYPGWTATTLSTANDGTSRVLWTNADGRAGIWTFSAADAETTIGATYGPYAGWTARSAGVAGDGTARVLWTNTNGKAGLWSFGANDAKTLIGPVYGPYSGWSAVSLATDTNGLSRVLWDNTDGEAGVWSFGANDAETIVGSAYGPYPGWTADAVGAAGDGTARVLWTNADGKAGVWSFGASDTQALIGTTYGPYPGYGAVALGVGSDGTARVLWDRSDRAAGVWSFSANGTESMIGSVYGPY